MLEISLKIQYLSLQILALLLKHSLCQEEKSLQGIGN